ncbi:hypothetical protein BDR26DRAFT_889591 [Obelidium mucronatum]|nr:hypothetical protein BDR26DRAFT_889591 [Obelidium mucronatum]
MPLSPACRYASMALQQEEITCSRGVPNDTLKNNCWCDVIDTDSVFAYCFADERNEWTNEYQDGVALRLQACAAVNRTVPAGKSLLALPSDIPDPRLVSLTSASSTAAATTTTASTTTATPAPFADGSECAAGIGYPTKDKAIQVENSDSSIAFTASSCNALCAANSTPGINYSAMVQSGPFVNCFCLINFEVKPAPGCLSCVTFPNYPGYPASNFANCGSGNPQTGAVSGVAVLPMKANGIPTIVSTTSVVTVTAQASNSVTGQLTSTTATRQLSSGSSPLEAAVLGLVALMALIL